MRHSVPYARHSELNLPRHASHRSYTEPGGLHHLVIVCVQPFRLTWFAPQDPPMPQSCVVAGLFQWHDRRHTVIVCVTRSKTSITALPQVRHIQTYLVWYTGTCLLHVLRWVPHHMYATRRRYNYRGDLSAPHPRRINTVRAPEVDQRPSLYQPSDCLPLTSSPCWPVLLGLASGRS